MVQEKKLPLSRRCFLKSAGTAAVATGVACSGLLSFTEACAMAKDSGERVVPTWCGMCGPAGNCAVYAFVKDGTFTRVTGMKEAPQNRGTLCPKAHAAPQWVYSPDRLLYPMRRVGKKGEGKFERITWNEGVRLIAEKLMAQKAEFGPESLAILSPAKRDYSDYLYRLLQAHGSPNYGHSGICAIQLMFGFAYTVGVGGRPAPDYENADVVLIWGKQPVYSGPPQGGPRRLVAARERKARIYAIKPSLEPDGSFAGEWVPIRPGTDAALALAMLHVVTREGLIDKDFVTQWCHGYESLAEHVRQYTPQWAEGVTGVRAGQIEDMARVYATTPKAAIDYGNGLEHAPSASDAIRAIAMLMAVTGHLDRPGGNLFPAPASDMPRPATVLMNDRYTPEMVAKTVGPEFPLAFQPFVEGTSSGYYRLFENVLSDSPTIRAMIAPGTQPSVSTRNPRGVIKALEKLDFYVVADTTRTADMAYADVVMPILTPYEIDHPFQTSGRMIMARNKVIEPLGEGRSMQQFMLDLGVAMGYGADFWNGDIKAAMDAQLKPLGMTYEELRAMPTGKLYKPVPRTYERYAKTFASKSPRLSGAPYLPQGKVALYATALEEAGFAPMPRWVEPPESLTGTPELIQKFPLVLSDYHTSVSYSASWQRNVPLLREIEPFPVLHIHPETARVRGIRNGDEVQIASPHGRIQAQAELYPGIRKDTVMMLHGWWQGCKELQLPDMPLLDGGYNVNLLYSGDPAKMYDPLITAMSSQTLVEVQKS